ncbi:hypothetical protein ACRRTK_013489 [Alexandromys fortis]
MNKVTTLLFYHVGLQFPGPTESQLILVGQVRPPASSPLRALCHRFVRHGRLCSATCRLTLSQRPDASTDCIARGWRGAAAGIWQLGRRGTPSLLSGGAEAGTRTCRPSHSDRERAAQSPPAAARWYSPAG